MTDNTSGWFFEYELRQFIYVATRYPIAGVYATRNAEMPFSIFTDWVRGAGRNYDLFCLQLRDRAKRSVNWWPLVVDLRAGMLAVVNGYIKWYRRNKRDLVGLEWDCPYGWMFHWAMEVRREIHLFLNRYRAREKKEKIAANS